MVHVHKAQSYLVIMIFLLGLACHISNTSLMPAKSVPKWRFCQHVSTDKCLFYHNLHRPLANLDDADGASLQVGGNGSLAVLTDSRTRLSAIDSIDADRCAIVSTLNSQHTNFAMN